MGIYFLYDTSINPFLFLVNTQYTMGIFGQLTFHWYGLIVGLAILAALTTAEKYAKKYTIPHALYSRCVAYVLIAGFSGARIWHVITDYHYYFSQHWLAVFSIWNGGMSIIGALIGGGLFIVLRYIYFPKERKYLLSFLDVLAIALPVGQIIGRIANFVNHELYGLPTQLPWGIYISPEFRMEYFKNQEYYHPLFAYEILAHSIFLASVWTSGIANKAPQRTGSVFALYLIWYCSSRFLLDFLRIDRGPLLGYLGINQCFVAIIWFLALFWLYKIHRSGIK